MRAPPKPATTRGSSLRQAIPEVRDRRRLDHPCALELARRRSEMVLEEAHAVAQKHGHDVQLQLVEQPRLEVLLRDVRAAAHRESSSPAASRACSSADSMPSVTNV